MLAAAADPPHGLITVGSWVSHPKPIKQTNPEIQTGDREGEAMQQRYTRVERERERRTFQKLLPFDLSFRLRNCVGLERSWCDLYGVDVE